MLLKQKNYAVISILTSLLCVNTTQATQMITCYKKVVSDDTGNRHTITKDPKILCKEPFAQIKYNIDGVKLIESPTIRFEDSFKITQLGFRKDNKRINYFFGQGQNAWKNWYLKQVSYHEWDFLGGITEIKSGTKIELYCIDSEEDLTDNAYDNYSKNYKIVQDTNAFNYLPLGNHIIKEDYTANCADRNMSTPSTEPTDIKMPPPFDGMIDSKKK